MNKFLSMTALSLSVFLGSYLITPVKAESDLQDATNQIGIIDTILKQNEYQDSVLDNHEDRITNNERDIAGIQTETVVNERVVVREVMPKPEPTPTPEPEPEPVTVVSYRQIPIEGSEDVDCEIKYSDGTSHRWHWQTNEYNQGSKTTNIVGHCDNSILGREKRDTPTGY